MIDKNNIQITDILFSDIVDSPMHCILVKVKTNVGIEGYGEVRDGASRAYLQVLRSRLIGKNPLEVEKIFRRVKQFGHHARQGGGVSGIEIALWDIVGKVYQIPIYQMLGGRFRSKIRVYCDTDIEGKNTGKAMGEALRKRLEHGYTVLKMDLGIDLLWDVPNALSAPLGLLDEIKEAREYNPVARNLSKEERVQREKHFDVQNIAHPFTGIQITEVGLDYLENYVKEVRDIIGYDVPLAIDHLGHISVNECIRLGKRIEKYNIAWMEDAIPWTDIEGLRKLSSSIDIPVCTGEDIYLAENFLPLLENRVVNYIHPDILTTGGISETKKIADLAEKHNVAMAIHMAESPIACLAAAHVATAVQNFFALEFHSNDVPWWSQLVNLYEGGLINNGLIEVSDAPGLGIESLNDDVIAQHLHPDYPELWSTNVDWNTDYSNDRLWS
jgi:gluconate/galactonate dehydratase